MSHIDKQATIDAIYEKANEELADANHHFLAGVHMATAVVRDMPEVQPKRMPGKWIYGEDEYGIDGYHCDKCGFFVPWDYAHKFINYIEDYKFCPGCGADMREVDDERPD